MTSATTDAAEAFSADGESAADAPVVLIAGSTGPLGRATARELVARGHRVALHCHRSRATADELAADLNSGSGPDAGRDAARVFAADLTTARAASALVASVQEWAPLGGLVNAAHPAESAVAPVAELGLDAIEAQLAAVTLHAALCQAVVPGFRERGSGAIVYVAGALMTRPAPGFGAFGAAKAAATTLTRYLALEEGRNGIRANIVAPGRVEPDEPEILDEEWARLEQQLRDRTAFGAFPTSGDVARAVATLIGPEGAMLTGQTLWVTGGEPIA